MAMTVGDVPVGYWFKLKRTGGAYLKLAKGLKGYHSLCIKEGDNTAWAMSNRSHVFLIPPKPKPRIRAYAKYM